MRDKSDHRDCKPSPDIDLLVLQKLYRSASLSRSVLWLAQFCYFHFDGTKKSFAILN